MPATAVARRSSTRPRPATSRRSPARAGSQARAARATAARRARPRSRGVTPPAGLLIPVAVGQRTAVAVGGLADSGLVHRLTRGRLWILLLAALLAGIVALNVLSLSFSASASKTARQADAIERENSVLRARLATDVSSEQIRAGGERAGLFMPAPGAIDYLRPGANDAEIAAKRLLDGELVLGVPIPPVPAPVAETSVEPATAPVAEATAPVAEATAPVATETAAVPAPAQEPTAPAPAGEAAPAPAAAAPPAPAPATGAATAP